MANLFALFFADGQDRVRWRNVVSRMLFNFIIRRLKPFSKVLLRVRQSEMWSTTFPQEITHKRVLKHCDEEFKIFLTTMEALGEKLGPLLFQFGRFDETVFGSLDDFPREPNSVSERLPKEHKFVVKIRSPKTDPRAGAKKPVRSQLL